MRLIYGLILLAAAFCVVAFWAWGTRSALAWAVAGLCFVAGAFGIFEGWAGWCVMRAMGFKTRY